MNTIRRTEKEETASQALSMQAFRQAPSTKGLSHDWEIDVAL